MSDAAPTEDGDRRGRGRISTLDQIPDDIRMWAMKELNARMRTQLDILAELNTKLADAGCAPVSRSAFNRTSMRVSAAAARIAQSRAIFSGLADQFTAEKMDESNIVIGEMLKMLIAEHLDGGPDEIDTKGMMELARGYLAVIQGQSKSADRRTSREEAFKKQAVASVAKVAKEAGFTADQVRQINREILGVRGP